MTCQNTKTGATEVWLRTREAVIIRREMYSKAFFIGCVLAASAEAFMPGAIMPRMGLRRAGNAASSLRMVDWSEPSAEEKYDGAGKDRGQINKSDEVGARTAERLAAAAAEAAARNVGSKSGLAGANSNLKEGDRDPATGRLILDPLKIPDSSQGAPGSWEEYMKMRKAKEGTVKDAMGNVIEDVKPSYKVQAGTWGPPKDEKVNVDDILGLNKAGDIKIEEVSAEQASWKKKKEEERSAQADEVEARMQKWLADAAAKKAAGQ